MATYGYDSTGKNVSALGSLYSSVQDQRSQLAKYASSKAAGYLQDGRYDEAIKEFKKALAFDPQNTDIYTTVGKIYLSQNKTYDAIKTFKEVVRLQPNSSTAHVNLGNAYLSDKQYNASETEFKAAARLDPLDPLANYTLGHQYITTDRLKEAEAQFKKVAAIAPRDGNVYYSLGVVYNKQNKSEAAASSLEQALRLKPNFPAANYELGIAYENLGKHDKAAAQLAILNTKDATLASDLKRELNKPKIVSMISNDGFTSLLGPRTQLYAIDPALITPNTSRVFSMTFQFNNAMSVESVNNPLNWSITRANSTSGGFYNDTIPLTSREATIPPIPLSVSYDPSTLQATISFRVSQNSNGDALIDPKHLVFTFKGKDAAGRAMDSSADQIDGYSGTSF